MPTTGLIDRFFLALLAAAAVALLATGCASIETPSMPALPSLPNLPESLSSWQAKDETTESPKSLAVVWKTAVLQAPGATPTRGFGGIVTFYGPDRKTPIKVDGQLTVYVYEDSPRTSEKVAPDAKFVVPADQLTKQYKESPLGHAYSVWVPWDKAGGPKRELMLTACFAPTEGDLVMGMPARVVLEAPPLVRRQTSVLSPPPHALSADRASHETPASGQPSPDRETASTKMITTTLSLPQTVHK